MVNIRTKGANGEREFANHLNDIVNAVLKKNGYPLPEKPIVQRNQNQTAVGGCDLVGTFGLAIEIKRQENLQISTWWRQCVKSALEVNGQPVLVFRQNNCKWRIIMNGALLLPALSGVGTATLGVRVEISHEDFSKWFHHHVDRHIQLNGFRV